MRPRRDLLEVILRLFWGIIVGTVAPIWALSACFHLFVSPHRTTEQIVTWELIFLEFWAGAVVPDKNFFLPQNTFYMVLIMHQLKKIGPKTPLKLSLPRGKAYEAVKKKACARSPKTRKKNNSKIA